VLLDGLPLAIAQAGAYLQESGVGLTKYLRFYEQQWSELMTSDHLADAPLQDYPERSVWTTWAISYQAIRERHEHTANLLLLWSFLDNKDLWHGLFTTACSRSALVAKMLLGWVGDIASSEIKFSRAMQLLCNYSLAEQVQETGSYATHPVVHQWAHHSQGKRFATELSRLAVVAVGHVVPESSTRDYAALQRRLLLHAQACSRQVVERNAVWDREAEDGGDGDIEEGEERKTVLAAVHTLGILYADQGRLGEAEKMCERALRGKEEALGVGHSSTLHTVNNLGNLYYSQGKLGEAEQMYDRALRGYEALSTVRVQQYLPALNTLQNMGDLYAKQAESAKARAVYARALSGLSSVLGASSERCIGLSAKIDALSSASREREGQSKLPTVGERPALQHDQTKKDSRLSMRRLMRKLC
jgi:tetratricopeptide (TPR) repeat protein